MQRLVSIFLKTTRTLLGFLIVGSLVVFIVGLITYQTLSIHLPNYKKLADYQPPIISRIYAGDGKLVGEFAKQKRLFTPFRYIPQKLVQAFLAAEDKNFYTHPGLDIGGIIRAVGVDAVYYFKGRRPIGASTITQQVAKNFFFNNKLSFARKAREAILALRLEHIFTKDKILELYLNQIYLGAGSYGVTAAAQTYFNAPLKTLTLSQIAFLAALPKAPNNYNPYRHNAKAIKRRNWVLKRMYEDKFITKAQMQAAQSQPLRPARRDTDMEEQHANYFVSEVRRRIFKEFGADTLYQDGLSIRTTIDLEMQKWAQDALSKGIISYDQRLGWRGAIENWSHKSPTSLQPLLALKQREDKIESWRLAIVTSIQKDNATILVYKTHDAQDILEGTIRLEDTRWAGHPLIGQGTKIQKTTVNSLASVLSVGDLIYVEPSSISNAPKPSETPSKTASGTSTTKQDNKPLKNIYQLRQIPLVNGAIVVADPHTGRLLAMQGGFRYDLSQFNRATQARRQPGSSFKPFVYATALNHDFTPATLIEDTPLVLKQKKGSFWRPKNYEANFMASITLRRALEESRNLATIRIAEDIGIKKVVEDADKFGLGPNIPPLLSSVLGASEVTLLQLTYAYSAFANQGVHVEPILIDRVQDRMGHTIWKGDQRPCPHCNAEWKDQDPPHLDRLGKRILSPQIAYQITSILKGVVEEGTGQRARIIGRNLAGKTGTTNQEKDAWFIGYSPNLLVGVYIGYDQPTPLGQGQTGGRVAAPIFRAFMEKALQNKPSRPFPIPPHIRFVRVHASTGEHTSAKDPNAIWEVFKDAPRAKIIKKPPSKKVSSDIGGLY